MRVRSPVWTSCVWSTSRRPPLWPTVWTRARTRCERMLLLFFQLMEPWLYWTALWFSQHCCVRSGRRNLRYLGPGDPEGSVWGQVHERRHLPGRRGLRPAPSTTHREGVQERGGPTVRLFIRLMSDVFVYEVCPLCSPAWTWWRTTWLCRESERRRRRPSASCRLLCRYCRTRSQNCWSSSAQSAVQFVSGTALQCW